MLSAPGGLRSPSLSTLLVGADSDAARTFRTAEAVYTAWVVLVMFPIELIPDHLSPGVT